MSTAVYAAKSDDQGSAAGSTPSPERVDLPRGAFGPASEVEGRWCALRLPRGRLGTNWLLIVTALYLALTQNQAFWRQVLGALPAQSDSHELGLLASLFAALNVLLLLVMAPLSPRLIVKPALITLLIAASVCSYFMDSFGVVIDPLMIANALQTDARETGELLKVSMLLHVLVFGLIPAALVWRVRIVSGSRLQELGRRFVLLLVALGLLLGLTLANYKHVSLWARAHREVRMYVNPTYPMYALIRHLKAQSKAPRGPVTPIATDAVRGPSVSGKPRMVVMVLGETARAANFQLAGYARATNPELSPIEGVLSFTQMRSCGTATAVSVPCMFSRLGRASYSRARAREEENLLDVLQRTGVSVSWRDNNSDSKGVSLRVPTEDFRHRGVNGLCDQESCYDEVLLSGLEAIAAGGTGDHLVVLHLLGSHGPSYYKRYPPKFRKFVPDCARDDVQSCSQDSIVNAYDNTMLYTDHVLANVIELLKRHQDRVEPVMVYLSDHGESLGENGLYLHGLPYALAPDDQKHVPFVVWSPDTVRTCSATSLRRDLSHDHLFHTMLGIFNVRSHEYHPEKDVLRECRSDKDKDRTNLAAAGPKSRSRPGFGA